MSVAKLLERISGRGWQGRVVRVEHLPELREAIEGPHARGLISEDLYRAEFAKFRYELPAELPGAKSIAVVAVPAPQGRVTFHWRGQALAAAVPPTYRRYRKTDESVRAVLAEWLAELGFRAAAGYLPLKTLAVRSGLAEWGRNNIAFVRGLGSHLQLAAAFTDMPCPDDAWREPKPLDRCASCTACVARCPTKAISKDRFLIDAGRCAVFHNESARPLPDYVAAAPFDSIVGCMRCQVVCPENKEVRKQFDALAELSEEETEMLVGCVPFDRLPAATAAKLHGLEINPSYEAICRNVGIFIRQNESPR